MACLSILEIIWKCWGKQREYTRWQPRFELDIGEKISHLSYPASECNAEPNM
jgi:hypothetical protein